MPFSRAQSDAACNFFEHVLKHTADEWYGKAFLLVPWQGKAFRLMVNSSVTWADWDEEPLAPELQEIQESDCDLSLTGFDPGEIDGLLALGDDEKANAAPPLPECVGPLYIQHDEAGDRAVAREQTRVVFQTKPKEESGGGGTSRSDSAVSASRIS